MKHSTSTNAIPLNTNAPWATRNLLACDQRDRFKKDLIEMLPRLRRFARSLTGSREQADDLLQAGCERALSRQYQFRPNSRLDSWLFTIMHSIRYNELREDGIRKQESLTELSALIPDETSPSPERNFFHNEVYKIVNTLPEQQRTAILLVYVEGYKYQEAAELLNIPVGTLMSRLARARAQVGKRVSEQKIA